MSIIELLLIAIALGADAFSVSVGVGARWHDWGSRLRLSFAFGLGQFVMPILGWTGGALILPYVAAYDHWVAFGVLVAISGKMLWESFRRDSDEAAEVINPTRGWLLPALALAVSIDALAVGFSMSRFGGALYLYALVIGVVASLMTLAGMILAYRGARHLGAWAGRLGALVLLGVAIKLLAV